MISFETVIFQYAQQSKPAIHDVTVCLEPGSFTVVAGPSGSGKSTLARCVNGLIPHFHGGRFGGRVVVNGLDTTLVTPATLSRHAGFVSQMPESQTVTGRVEDEIAFGLENLGVPESQIRFRVEEMLDLLHLNVLRERPLETLSGGERQRVVIAAAMAMRPSILILDEPTSQLDPSSTEEILGVLTHMNHELGTTILVAEHRLDRLLGLADHLIMMNESGSVESVGSTRDVIPSIRNLPPLQLAARELGWPFIPLTVRDARRFIDGTSQIGKDLDLPKHHSTVDGEPSVALEKVSFGYDHEQTLSGVSVTFHPGSVTALMGRNGSGKTTLLKLINGLLRPHVGRVCVDGRDIKSRSTADLAPSIGYLPQNAGSMLFNDTVAAEIDFTLRCQRKTGDRQETLDRIGITSLADRNPLDLSGGERLRAALAAILVANPHVLLLDEPTRGVDVSFKQLLGRLMRELVSDGTTVIVATHDVDLVAEFADRVIVLGNGFVVADGPPHDVMPGSLTLSTHINRTFGGELLTLNDVREASRWQQASDQRSVL